MGIIQIIIIIFLIFMAINFLIEEPVTVTIIIFFILYTWLSKFLKIHPIIIIAIPLIIPFLIWAFIMDRHDMHK